MTLRQGHQTRRIKVSVALAITILAGLSVGFPAVKASSLMYSVTDLGSLGGSLSEALGINNAGTVVGYSTTTQSIPPTSTQAVPFVYANGAMTAASATYGWATAINAIGQITGFTLFPGNPNVDAFIYQNGRLMDLGGLPGYSNMPYSVAWAINAAGTVAGESKAEAMIYQNGRMIGFSRRAAQSAYGINDNGDVVGILSTMTQNHAFLFSGNNLQDLGTLDGDKEGTSLATAINNRGQVVGSSWINGNSVQRAFLYQNGVMTDLGTLRGGYAAANGINNSGYIVGESDGSAFLFHNGVMIDLNSAIQQTQNPLTLNRARGINDLGQIVGLATFANEGPRGFLLTPIQ